MWITLVACLPIINLILTLHRIAIIAIKTMKPPIDKPIISKSFVLSILSSVTTTSLILRIANLKLKDS